MRVIAGKAKGKNIKSPKSVSIRPTSDLIRGAIFSILESMDADWSAVLEFYAGTGSMGIEALSRGAGWVDLVEQDSKCCAAIKENLENTGLTQQAHIYCLPAIEAISILDRKYGIVLMGPPYKERSIIDTIEHLVDSPLVGEGSTIVVEHSYRVPLSPRYGSFHLSKERRHGDTCISVYQ
jgi:16S rRNA (guanine(966)-N(2))-methyltransferase RsmD